MLISEALDRSADVLALDRASVRSRDENGYLHVAVSNISKACVNPYFGEEIPDYQALGLDRSRIYYLFRAPEELEKAAATFNGMPLHLVHKPQAARSFAREIVVGTLGNSAEFVDPYLRNSLTVWDAGAIAGIETGEQRQISCGYRYDADMTPGEYNGVKYDGVMRNLRGNHAAIVPDGRAGCDVIVGDQDIQFIVKELPSMAKAPLSRKAALVKGTLAVHLAPKLAQDAKLDFSKLLAGVTAKNFTSEKAKIVSRLTEQTKGKLAQDATLDDVNLLLDKLDDTDDSVSDDLPVAGKPPVVEDEEDPDDMSAFLDSLKDKLSPEEHAKLCAALNDNAPPAVVGDVDPDPEGEKDTVSKQAMDAALKATALKVSRETEAAVIGRLNAVREAENDVRPYIGALSVAQDSAESVYRMALDALNYDHKALKDILALKAVLLMHPKPGEQRQTTPRIAQDSAAADAYAKRFPAANRLSAH